MLTCTTCGTANTGEARFCSSCGGSLLLKCASCGADLPVDARFCSACGAAVSSETGGPVDERRVVSVLFADVTGSTTLGELLDPNSSEM